MQAPTGVQRWLILLMVLFASTVCAVNARSMAGLKLDEAEQEDFFTWFHFKQVDRKPEPGDKTEVSFETGVGGYTVTLGVTLDKQQNITDMVLALPREFVQDPKYGMNAADVSKSFISATVPESDFASVKDLSNEIAFSGKTWTATKVDETVSSTGEVEHDATLLKAGPGKVKKGDSAWINTGPMPKLPQQASSGFLTYIGKRDEFDKNLPDASQLKIRNSTMAGKKYVLLIVNIHHN